MPLDVVGQVLILYREQYADFNVLHFQEKLRTQHGIDLPYTWVKTALQTAGLVASHARRGSHRQARPWRPVPGMLQHTDASTHPWIPGLDGRQDLIAVLDDATSAADHAHLGPEESTRTMLAALQGVIETRGLFCALYVNRATPMATCSSITPTLRTQRPTRLFCEHTLGSCPVRRGSRPSDQPDILTCS